jgi:hypothetical protein
VTREIWLRQYRNVSKPKALKDEEDPWGVWYNNLDDPKYHNVYKGKKD